MTISESPDDIRLTEEIADLRAALDGTPAVLREQGLFAAYESRLRLLQGELLSLRLAPLVTKYQRQLKIDGTVCLAETGPAGVVSDAGRISLATEAIESLRLEQHRMISSYRYVVLALGVAIVAGGISLFAVDTSNLLAIKHIDVIENIGRVLTTLLAIGLLWVWELEKTKTDADHHLELLRTQLEFLSSFYNSNQPPLPQVYDRTLKLLDEARIV